MIKKITTIEAIKTLNNSTFRTIILLHAILFLLVTLVASSIKINLQGITLDKVFQFPHIWNTVAWFASWFNLLLGMLSILLITNEFQFRTFRKQIIDGLSRNEIIVGKVLVMLFLAAYTMLLVFLCGMVLGIVKTSSFSLVDLVDGLKFLPVLYIQALAYMILAMLFAFMFRNPALSIVAYILYFFPIEPIIRAFIPDSVVPYMPVKIISKLTPMPDFIGISLSDMIEFKTEQSSELLGSGLISTTPSLAITSLLVITYCLLYVFISKIIVARRNF